MKAFNAKFAEKITNVVGSMWCAYAFALLTLISLPAAIHSGDPIIIVGWIAQTFLQLVLLSIIMVGQGIQSAEVATKIDETHDASLAEFELAKEQRAAHGDEMLQIKVLAQEVADLLASLPQTATWPVEKAAEAKKAVVKKAAARKVTAKRVAK